MPEETTSQQITKNETVEVIGLDGKGQDPNKSSLADMFSKIEAGKEEGLTSQEVVREEASRPRDDSGKFTKEVKKEEVKEEVKEEKKAEPSDLDKKLTETQEKKDEKQEDDPRASLRKSTEAKKEEVKDVKSETKEEAVPEEELQVLPHDKPKTAKRITALLGKIKNIEGEATKTKAEALEKATKLAELEKKLAEVKTVNPETDEKVKKSLDELAMYRRRYELEKDPEVKTKFDSRVEYAEESIIKALKARAATDPLINLIKEEGGWAKFSDSARLVSIPDGEGGTRQVPASELAELILGNLPLGERKGIEAAMMEQVQTKRDKERYFKEQQEKATEYFKQREDEAQKGTVEQQKQIEEARKTIDAWQKQVEASDWIKDKVIPEGAAEAEKAAIVEHNKYNAQLRSLLNKSIGTKDLNGMLEIVQDSVRYYDERRATNTLRKENDRLKAELQAKHDEITRFKTGSRAVPKSGSISTSSTPQTAQERKPVGLEAALRVLEEGGNFRGDE